MAKCPICNSRKGKRKCAVVDDKFVCSLCCGTSRDEEKCDGCVYYQAPRRKYNAVPYFSVLEMRDSFDLDDESRVLEGGLSAFNAEQEDTLTDLDAIGIYELLIDKYHFKDAHISSDNPLWQQGFEYIDIAIETDIKDLNEERITKLIATVRTSARKHTAITGCEYMTFIRQYVGQRIGTGARLLNNTFLS
ncbi:MAG: hypothetical protein GQ569_05935 [Methylococcaceae bacterium]|nr:hypothetical protein [Methylococcaceae bacterium]